ncbi:hypothetical protein IWZ01DRAFT_554420 [Phyllosticta capitalensis]
MLSADSLSQSSPDSLSRSSLDSPSYHSPGTSAEYNCEDEHEAELGFDLELIPAGQGSRSFHGPTGFDKAFPRVEDVMHVLREHWEGATLDEVLGYIPEGAEWVRRMLPVFKQHKGKAVYLVFGSCRKKNELMDFVAVPDEKKALTLHILSAFQQVADAPIILMDLCPACHARFDKERPYENFCAHVDKGSSDRHRIRNALRLELWIAQQDFQITFKGIFTFASPMFREYPLLLSAEPQLAALPQGAFIPLGQAGFGNGEVSGDYEVGMILLGWFFHYFPFYLMQRQLFLHYYFLALYFAIMGLALTYDFVTKDLESQGATDGR